MFLGRLLKRENPGHFFSKYNAILAFGSLASLVFLAFLRYFTVSLIKPPSGFISRLIYSLVGKYFIQWFSSSEFSSISIYKIPRWSATRVNVMAKLPIIFMLKKLYQIYTYLPRFFCTLFSGINLCLQNHQMILWFNNRLSLVWVGLYLSSDFQVF